MPADTLGLCPEKLYTRRQIQEASGNAIGRTLLEEWEREKRLTPVDPEAKVYQYLGLDVILCRCPDYVERLKGLMVVVKG